MSVMTEAAAATQYIIPSSDFAGKFNRESFVFHHNLAQHPLFTLPRLFQLARDTQRSRPQDLYYDAAQNVGIGQRWETMGDKPPLEEAMEQIDQAGAWITLHQAQEDPEYGAIFHECMNELASLTGVDFKKVMRVEDALIFITSPNRVTTYHIDRECNFLLQVSGSKTIHLFDRKDREVLSELEIERFWTVDNNAATYKPAQQDKAKSIRLVPGNAVHIPVNDPHWLKNDDNVSVSLSVNFTWRDSELANVYRANHLLRKLGMKPSPPGQSAIKDGAKKAIIAASYVPARDTVRLLRRLKGKPTRAT